MDYVFVIPSYRRAKLLKEKTWALIQRIGPNIKPIIWVNDMIDYEEYSPLFPTADIRVGGNGIAEKRNMIQDSFPLDTKIVMMDDDIRDLVIKDGNKRKKVKDLDAVIRLGFSYCEQENCSLWGVYPMDNPLSMTNNVRRNLCYVIAAFFGMINKRINIELDCAEDLERTMKYWLLEKKVIRLEFIGLQTKYYNPIGGLSELRKQGRNDIDKTKLYEMYPSYCKLFHNKKLNITDLKFISKKDVIEIHTIPSDL